MNKIDLIIDALERWQHSCLELGRCSSELGLATKALAAARELKDELYVKEMEQPTPKQSGVMSITVSKVCEAGALPPTANAVYWMDMVVANLVRNGVNKHRAKELAHHFYTYTTPLYALDEVKHDFRT
jgi:hypothetical protein